MKTCLIIVALSLFYLPPALCQDCEQQGDFKACPSSNPDSAGQIVFSDGTAIDIYADHVFFRDTGVSYAFADQKRPDSARQSAAACLATPASFCKRFGKAPDNWRMRSAPEYWNCLVAQQLALDNAATLLERHKDLVRKSLYLNTAYAAALADYLAKHFGDAPFDVYTLSQQEQAYKALHSRKWN